MGIVYSKENDIIYREETKEEIRKIEINATARIEILDNEINELKEKLIVLEKEKADLIALL